jgi:2-amino-4-hydroxy-6-hydroxymethyldihydropteridine diphosphokinase
MTMDARSAFVGAGANRGERLANLHRAARHLAAGDAVSNLEASPVYETEAHTPDPDGGAPSYLNAVLRLRTTLSPEALLDACQSIEREAGRNREGEERWGARPLDLDLLAVGEAQRQTERLTLPHPRLAERRFVLRPWANLAPQFEVPAPFEATVADLLRRCRDVHDLRRTEYTLL